MATFLTSDRISSFQRHFGVAVATYVVDRRAIDGKSSFAAGDGNGGTRGDLVLLTRHLEGEQRSLADIKWQHSRRVESDDFEVLDRC